MKNAPLVPSIIVIFLVTAPVFGGFYNLFVIAAIDSPGEFVKLTTYGFAIFVGLSSMLFNWAKDPNISKDLSVKLNNTATNSVFCSVGFLIANLIKYVSSVPKNISTQIAYLDFNRLVPFFSYMVYIWLAIVAYLTIHILLNMLSAYYEYKIKRTQL